MSEKLTRITLPNSNWPGFMDWGELPVDEMVEQVKRYAKETIARERAVLNAKPEDFQIDVVRGSIVQHHIKELQKSERK